MIFDVVVMSDVARRFMFQRSTAGVAHHPKKKKTCTIDHSIIPSCEATFVLCCLVMPLEPHFISSSCVFDRFLPCHEKRNSF